MTSPIRVFFNAPASIDIKMIRRGEVLTAETAWKEPFLKDTITAEVVQAALFKGPFVALAKVGPTFYDEAPIKLQNQIAEYPGLPVYGWAKGSTRKAKKEVDGSYESVIVCGVKKEEALEHVYFVRAQEIHTDWREGLGKYDALSTDRKVYVTSLKRFSESLYNMYPVASESEIAIGTIGAVSREATLRAEIEALLVELQNNMKDSSSPL